MYTLEGETGFTAVEDFQKTNPETVHAIDDIFSYPEDVYASFIAEADVDTDALDPLDLQSQHIAAMQAQRKGLLEALELLQVSENMRDPVMYFEGIASSFFDHCGPDRTVWSRAHISSELQTITDEQGNQHVEYAQVVRESAHTATFRRDSNQMLEPQIKGRIGCINGEPQFFELRSNLQQSKSGHEYHFYSSPRNGLEVFEVDLRRPNEPEKRRVEDKIERFTLLQALTVDLYDTVTNLQHENDRRVHSIVAREVYGPRM